MVAGATAVVLDKSERKAHGLVQRLQTIRNEKVKKRRAKNLEKRAEREKRKRKEDEALEDLRRKRRKEHFRAEGKEKKRREMSRY